MLFLIISLLIPILINMTNARSSLALVTGASTGIGYELAKCCAKYGYNLLIAADELRIHDAAANLRSFGVQVEAIEADLATFEGVDKLYSALKGRPVEALFANAGHGLGKSFLDQDVNAWKHVLDTNITGTLYLIQKVAGDMLNAGHGRIMITGSLAGLIPGTYQAVYNGTKAFLNSFSFALRHELKDSGVSVTCLMPGATETDFFERADMTDTKVAQSKKDDPASVAQQGFDAMMNGEGEVITGWRNKLYAAIASVVSADISAEIYGQMAAPGSGKKKS
jgi:uncharacterized protein